MIPPRLATLVAIVRKDLLILWPLAAASLVLPLCALASNGGAAKYGPVVWGIVLGLLATCILTVSLFHQDAPSSSRQDWHTRPIGPINLFLAKLLFLALVVLVPHFVAATTEDLLQGHSLAEALVAGLYGLRPAVLIVAIFAVLGIVTSSLIEALIVIAIPSAATIALTLLTTALNPPLLGPTPLRWMPDLSLMIVAVVCGVLAVWLVYRAKSATWARVVLVLGGAFIVINPLRFAVEPAFALQRSLSRDPAAAAQLSLLPIAHCKAEPAQVGAGLNPFPSDPEVVLFQTGADVAGLPKGWIAAVDRNSAAYIDRQGSTLSGLRPVQVFGSDGRKDHIVTWLAPARAHAMRLAEGARLRLHKDVTLLKPVASVDLVVDGPRTFTTRFGWCSATTEGARIGVRCFAPFSTAGAVRVTAGGEQLNGLRRSYGPDLGRLDVNLSFTVKPDAQQSGKVRLTQFKPQAHVVKTNTLDLAAIDGAPECREFKISNATGAQ